MPAVGDDKTVCPAWGEKIGQAAGGGSAAAGAGQLDSELAGEQLRRSWNNLHSQPGAQEGSEGQEARLCYDESADLADDLPHGSGPRGVCPRRRPPARSA